MFTDLLDIDEIRERRAVLSRELDEHRQRLNQFAAEGASLTVAGVTDCRFKFGMCQAELIIRAAQIEEFESGGELEGSQERAIQAFSAYEKRFEAR